MSMLPGSPFDKSKIVPPAKVRVSEGEVARARRFVAGQSTDAVECTELLEALGIGFTPEEIQAKREAS